MSLRWPSIPFDPAELPFFTEVLQFIDDLRAHEVRRDRTEQIREDDDVRRVVQKADNFHLGFVIPVMITRVDFDAIDPEAIEFRGHLHLLERPKSPCYDLGMCAAPDKNVFEHKWEDKLPP